MLSKEVIALKLGLRPQPFEPDLVKPQLNAGEVVEQLRLLLRGFAMHAQGGEQSDRIAFQNHLNEAADSLRPASTSADLQRAIAKALAAIEEYESRRFASATEEMANLRRMLQAMTETLIFVSGSSDSTVKHLGVIEQRLSAASSRHATSQLKPVLDHCLNLLRQECQRIQAETQQKIAILQKEVQELSACLVTSRVSSPADPVTSLPARASAERAMQETLRGGKSFLTALFVLERLAAVNGAFGRDAGDDLLLMAARTIANGLPEVTLYRWSGPAILAVLNTKTDSALAQSRAQKIAEARIEKNVGGANGMQLASVACALHLQRISPDLSLDSVFHTFDTFIAAR